MSITENKILTGLFNPSSTISYLLRILPMNFAFRLRVQLNGISRPFYAYCIWYAALEAKKLGIKRVSVIEFGVASGGGLMAIERIAEQVTKHTGVEIDIYGFDLGHGLPAPRDYRDLAFMWKKGFFKMDEESLRKKIKKTTKLILGDVAKTVPQFMKNKIAPIGFVSFDLDYYTSTVNALKIFDLNNEILLPRVFCYFDDLIGNDEEIYSQYTGEALAIREFNNRNKYKKLDVINGLVHKRIIKDAPWYEEIYILHIFNHSKYNNYIYSSEDRQ